MFVMASPLQEHVSETLTSLKFATKVSFIYNLQNVFIMLTQSRFIIHILERQRNLQKSAIEIASNECSEGVRCWWIIIFGVQWKESRIPNRLLGNVWSKAYEGDYQRCIKLISL
jgi:hypothetical protein